MRAEPPTRSRCITWRMQRAADEAQRMVYGHRLAEYLKKGSHFLPLISQDRLSRLSMDPDASIQVLQDLQRFRTKESNYEFFSQKV
jgi:hypothetical protein